MKKLLTAGALALALTCGLGGCADLASFVASTATDLSSSTPSQVTTYGDATAAATLATRTVDLAVNTANLNAATLNELSSLNDALHAAWLVLKAANDGGKSLDFAAFNAALAAYQSYKTSQGIADAPAPAAAPTS